MPDMPNKELIESKIKYNRDAKCRNPYFIILDDRVVEVCREYNNAKNTYDYTVISNAIRIKEISNDVTTLCKRCTIEFLNFSNVYETKEVPLDELLDKNKIVKLATYGVDVSSNNAQKLLYHTNNELRHARLTSTSAVCGIAYKDNKAYFVGADTIAKEGVTNAIEYNGQLALDKAGCLDICEEMLDKHIFTSVPMQVMFALGLSAPLVAYVGDSMNVTNIIAHISGDSTTGKSTALKFVASLFGSGKGDSKHTGLFGSWNMTENAMMNILSDNNGVPYTMDEAGMKKNKNFASIIYRLAEGRDKSRMNYIERSSERKEWSTTIISSGEILLDDKSDQSSGQSVRVLAFNNVKWTDSAIHSDNILSVVQDNYGHIGYVFVQQMLKINKGKIRKAMKNEKECIMKQLHCGAFNSRTADVLSIIICAAKIAKKKYNKLNVKHIREFLVKYVNETRSDSNALGERAYQVIQAEIARQTNKIEVASSNGKKMLKKVACSEVFGRARVKNTDGSVTHSLNDGNDSIEYEWVAIPEVKLNDLLHDNGFLNPQVVYAQWAKQKHIVLDGHNNYIHKIKIGNVGAVKCIKVNVKTDK